MASPPIFNKLHCLWVNKPLFVCNKIKPRLALNFKIEFFLKKILLLGFEINFIFETTGKKFVYFKKIFMKFFDLNSKQV